ncbi:tetraspanin-2A-like [Daphnia pulicaria]|uniref:tetraspanin-2A-like n=1 Tax=Daphnia pulicaria TaxID=35523 RepID=UPI001EEABF10|nr:tetraspanin-2A-like [Daphnia pulicaria]
MNEDVSLVEFADGIIESTSVISGVEITGVADDHDGGCDDLKDRIHMSTVVDKRNKWTTSSKYFLCVFNVVSLVLGIVVLAMAIYIFAEWTLKHYIYEMEAYFFWTGPYILMASSSLTIFLSFFGCWATVNENPFLLTLLGCCEGSGWRDYSDNHMEIPHECRSQITGNMHVYGCGIVFSDYVEPLIGWMCGIAILLIVLQIFAIVAAVHPSPERENRR